MNDYTLYLGDCLEKMKEIEDNSIDMILTDLPYGVLNPSNKSAKLQTRRKKIKRDCKGDYIRCFQLIPFMRFFKRIVGIS